MLAALPAICWRRSQYRRRPPRLHRRLLHRRLRRRRLGSGWCCAEFTSIQQVTDPAGDAAVLDEAASTLKANPNVTINVNGYCDAIGGEEYNLKLSDRRSDAVVDYLVKAGIPSSQLIPHGHGKTTSSPPTTTPRVALRTVVSSWCPTTKSGPDLKVCYRPQSRKGLRPTLFI